MFTTGAARIPRTTKHAMTTGIGRCITLRAVRAQRPSSFGVIALRRITPLSTLCPKIASNAGSANIAPETAREITATPARPKDFKKLSGKNKSEAIVTKTVKPE